MTITANLYLIKRQSVSKPPKMHNAIEFALLIAILLVKPAGILGKTRKEKV